MTSSSPTANIRNAPWLSGPWSDLLLGCGLVYLIAFAALAIDGETVRETFPLAITPFLVLLTGVPHYGATLLRVYEQRADRRRYAFFAALATLAVAIAFGIGLYEVTVGSWLLTIYLTWSPWHYSGQNYGIALMFMRRRGVAISVVAKRLFYASFLLSFLLAAVMMHTVDPGVSYAPGQYEGTVYRLIPLDLPAGFAGTLIPLLTIAYIASLAGAGWLLTRSGSIRDLLPAAALVVSQALWFVVPALARRTETLQGIEPFGTEHATYTFLWIAATHAVQYLWITHFYAKARGDRSLAWAGKALSAGAAIWMVPALLCAPGVLGGVPFDAGLGLLIASVVNIHHFILDGAIWKLRDGPVARLLLRKGADPDLDREVAPRRTWMSRSIYLAGAGCVICWCVATWEQAYGFERGLADGDVERVETAQRRMRWIGQESARVHFELAKLYQSRGDDELAATRAKRGAELHPGADSLFELSTLYHRARQGDDAIEALERALALRPTSRPIRNRLALLLVNYRPGDEVAAKHARDLSRSVVAETGKTNATYLHTLAQAQAAGGDFGAAIETERTALAVAEDLGQERLAELIRRFITRYASAAGNQQR